ncbi:hypothetical protein CMO83_03320 [Candidatus Woesearchaeota archaeon]|jgi:uncharacterized membrane protein|nr:hypothetical protein [Candidatus Woesearchaeota archaeon]MAG91680.1 hypothetical protein [Candidatus Woesearchaeota archaeon]|tara:strand:- start:16264 stop:16971 length:708 start_codon:yes stop_codon:yes gene_type:complete
MVKKRGKHKHKASSKKHAKKAHNAPKHHAGKPKKEHTALKDTLHHLEILAEEQKTGHKIEDVEKKEEEIEHKEDQIVKEERKIEKETEKVEGLEKKIVKEVQARPLRKFDIKDINKGIIGAFIGVVAHFGFIYGKEIAKQISTSRASLILFFSYFMIIVLMYETGYRDIKEKRLLRILPKRATLVYLTSLVVIVVIFLLFNLINISEPIELYKGVAVTSVLAALGAGTADLIGRN